MRTVTSTGATASLMRDLRLLFQIASMILDYWLAGGRLRREYRRREARGEVLWLDEVGPTRHREAPLRGDA
jgi:hypothetical protein